jgi:hypothetical protein
VPQQTVSAGVSLPGFLQDEEVKVISASAFDKAAQCSKMSAITCAHGVACAGDENNIMCVPIGACPQYTEMQRNLCAISPVLILSVADGGGFHELPWGVESFGKDFSLHCHRPHILPHEGSSFQHSSPLQQSRQVKV